MIVFTVEGALTYMDESVKLTKKKREQCLRAEIFLTTRTTPNNIFIALCKRDKKKRFLLYWITRGRERYKFLKFNNFFSVRRMFSEVVAFTIRNKQTVYRLIGKGRNKMRPLSKELNMWRIPVFFIQNKIRRPFNGCKFPHTRRV